VSGPNEGNNPEAQRVAGALAAALVALGTAGAAVGQVSSPGSPEGGEPAVTVEWSVVPGGGGRSIGVSGSGVAWGVSGLAGQPAAGPLLAGGNFSFGAGFLNSSVVHPRVPCAVDFNRDGAVNGDDLTDFIAAYFSPVPPLAADIDGNGLIDSDDLADFLGLFFGGC
jgi:hypothetical protein